MEEDKTKTAEERSKRFWFIRKIGSKRVILTLLALVLLYTLGGFFLLPYVLKGQLIRYAEESLNRPLALEEVRFNPYALTLDMNGFSLSEADGARLIGFDAFHVNLQASSLFKWAWTFREIRFQAPFLHLEVLPDGTTNLERLMADAAAGSSSAKEESGEEDEGQGTAPRMVMQLIRISDGEVSFTDRTHETPAKTRIRPINLSVRDLSTLPDREAPHSLAASLPGGGTAEWNGTVSLHPIGSQGTIQLKGFRPAAIWSFFENRLALERPEGTVSVEAGYRFSYQDQRVALTVDPIRVGMSGLGVTLAGSTEPSLEIGEISLDKGRFDLDGNRLVIGLLRFAGGQATLSLDENGRPDWQGLVPESGPQPADEPTPEGTPPFRVDLDRLAVEEMALHMTDRSHGDPLQFDLDRLDLALSVGIEAGPGGMEATADGLEVDLHGMRLKGAPASEPALEISRTSLQGGRFSLAGRTVEIDRIALEEVRADVIRDEQGAINWMSLLGGREGAKAEKTPEAPTQGGESGATPWSLALHALQMMDSSVRISDIRGGAPDLCELSHVRLDLEDITTDPAVPIQVDLTMDVGEEGSAAVKGKIHPSGPRVEADIQVLGIALPPFQPYLDPVAVLSLDSGNLSAEGSVRYDPTGAAKGAFRGELGIENLLLTLPGEGKRLLAWQAFTARGIDLGLEPARMKIDEIVFDEPSGEFIIRKDGSISLEDVIRKKDGPEEAPPLETEAKTGKDTGGPSFPVEIKRIKMSRGELDFADLSLLPNFGVRIHDLEGMIAGLSNRPGRRATMELEGGVDEYGSARIKGELDLADATSYSDVGMRFENIEMTNMTPYSGKFAGYRINSGRLSMDLDYKIKDRKVQGNNHIVMDQLTLGERMESPDALGIPLGLALALLKDADGRIDIGLPVSGDLDDPQFSFGRLIWKAVGNFLTKIVTAPFRALGSLLGLDGEDLDRIGFEPGEAAVPPPEKEKLVKLAQALEKRPQLAVEVQGGYDPARDGFLLRTLAVRTELAMRAGVALGQGEDPGPVDFSDPETLLLLGGMAAEVLPTETVSKLQGEFGMAPPPKGSVKDKPLAAAQPEKPQKARPIEYGKALFDALVEKIPVNEADLKALAGKRAEAIQEVLTAALQDGDADRVFIAESVTRTEAEEGPIPCKLSMTAEGSR